MAAALNDTTDDDDVDLVVVGAGAGGMTAALVAALEGQRVILAEASDQVGGTTSTSAGTLWVPGNPHGARAGHRDSVQAAATYLEALVGPDDERGRRQAFLETAGEALEYLERRSTVIFTSAGRHPDYVSAAGAAIAGRAVGPLPFDGRTLGEDFARIRPPRPEFMLLGGMMVGKADIQALIGRYGSWRNFLHSARLVARYASDRLRHRRGTRLVMGNALVARLFQSLRAAKVDIRFGWRLRDLDVRDGRVIGASFEDAAGAMRRVAARAGVVLATGGIGHEAALRRELVPGGDRIHSLAAQSVRGDGLLAARRVGAVLERHALGNLLWQPVSVVPGAASGGGLFPHLFLDRAKPGLIAVNSAGRRFVDDSISYHHFIEGLLPQGQAWLVCDADFVRRYGLGVIPPGARLPGPWARNGYIHCEPTLAALAQRVGIDEKGLAQTVERTNGFAATGRDLDFARGETEVGRFNGDPAHAPNPCLGPIDTPPFCALQIHAADAASSAGLATDRDGRVLDAADAPIPGLYACGNDAASIVRGSYPGPGATLGPAVVFGYRVGRHAARADNSGPHPR
jgi:succinate dehydrogenase/fumarate reductase flavoprotein subunit